MFYENKGYVHQILISVKVPVASDALVLSHLPLDVGSCTATEQL